jgi:hypothetical protein
MRGVMVGNRLAVGVGVRVTEGVAVGIVEVTVGRSDGVGVGTVEVGKGPSSSAAVRASAVFVRAAWLEPPPFTRQGFPNARV